ncbi:hypothetical protein TDB9533_03430 [Thalassocella blandensis]|nr:hypothetical protein TDB9533_03430 [Thalassocella blandensis]
MNPCRILCLFTLMFIAACSSNYEIESDAIRSEQNSSAAPGTNTRLVQRSARLEIEVDNVDQAQSKINMLFISNQGLIESTSSRSEKRLWLSGKVPAEALDTVLSELHLIGKVTSESLNTADVTDTVLDIDARLSNLKQLRERFRALLAKASAVEELISIEKELARIQTDIDSIESRRQQLLGDVAQSNIHITLRQKAVLGPLGLVGKGFVWVVTKLFVLN